MIKSTEPLWIYKGKYITEIPDIYMGFVYRISCLENGKMYLGRKYCRMKRGRRHIVNNGWKSYWGSSTRLHEDIERYGFDKFRREILVLCTSKSWCRYKEVEYIIREGAIEPVRGKDYYNALLSCRIRDVHLPLHLKEEKS